MVSSSDEVAALGDLDRVDLADEVGDRRVGGGELLAEATVAVHPLDRGLVAALGEQHAGVLRDRVVRVVVDLAAGDDRHPLVEQRGERADHAGLRLTTLAEEDHVVAGDERVLELGQDGVLVADDAFDERTSLGDARQRVGPHLLLDRARLPSVGLELAEGSGTGHAHAPVVVAGGGRERSSGHRIARSRAPVRAVGGRCGHGRTARRLRPDRSSARARCGVHRAPATPRARSCAPACWVGRSSGSGRSRVAG